MTDKNAEHMLKKHFKLQEKLFSLPEESKIKAFNEKTANKSIAKRNTSFKLVPIMAATMVFIIAAAFTASFFNQVETGSMSTLVNSSEIVNSQSSEDDSIDASFDNESNINFVNYSIYYYPSAGEIGLNENSSATVTLKNAETKQFSFASKTEINKPSDVEDQISFELNGKTYLLQYNRTFETALSSSENLKDYSKFNEYKSETVRVYTRVSTGEILFFSNVDENDRKASGDLTADDAKKIADSTLLTLYGSSIQEEYLYDTTVQKDSRHDVHHTVVYRKYVWGVPTKDKIQISVNMKGDVVALNAIMLGVFSQAEDQLTKKEIDDAISVLHEALSNECTMFDETLTVDSKGAFYIYAQLSRTTGGLHYAVEVYINIKNTDESSDNSSNNDTQDASTEDEISNITDNKCTLIVNGIDITEGSGVKIYDDRAELPFVAIMEALGATFDWESDNVAIMCYKVNRPYVLNIAKGELTDYVGGDGRNHFTAYSDSSLEFTPLEKEILIDDISASAFFSEMGFVFRISYFDIDFEDKIIKIGRDTTDYKCTLIVNGNDITDSAQVVMKRDDGNYTLLPFVAIMEELGAKFEWESDYVAKIEFREKNFTLNIEECELIAEGNKVNLISPVLGGTRKSFADKQALTVDNVTLKQFFDAECIDASYDYEEKIVRISSK